MADKKENPLLSIVLNVALPSIILMKASSPDRLGPLWALVVALSFPIGYGIYDYLDRRKVNFISILGLISVGLTGVFTIIKLPPEWIAIKEAAIPALIGIAILASMRTEFPLVKKIIFNDTLLNVDLVNSQLDKHDKQADFAGLLQNTSYLLAGSFFLSSVLNYILAKTLLVSAPGTEAFNAELGQMTFLSYPVIVLPSTAILMFALFRLVKGVKSMTGLELEQILHGAQKPAAK